MVPRRTTRFKIVEAPTDDGLCVKGVRATPSCLEARALERDEAGHKDKIWSCVMLREIQHAL